MTYQTNFPAGVVVFFRLMLQDQSLARSVHPSGRYVQIGGRESHADDYVIQDENERFLGSYPREFVAAILPLETVGPAADAGNSPIRSQH